MAHTRRDGVPTLLKVAQLLCNGITKFTPILTQLYGSNVALMAALSAANAACSELSVQLAVVRQTGD